MTKTNAIIGFFAAFFIMLTIMLSGSPPVKSLSVREIKAQATDLPYELLAREPARWNGMTVVFEGKVVQSFDSMLRVDVDDLPFLRRGGKIIWVDYKKSEPRILEGDKVKFWGTFAGIGSYKTVLGQTVEIPHVKALIVENEGPYQLAGRKK